MRFRVRSISHRLGDTGDCIDAENVGGSFAAADSETDEHVPAVGEPLHR